MCVCVCVYVCMCVCVYVCVYVSKKERGEGSDMLWVVWFSLHGGSCDNGRVAVCSHCYYVYLYIPTYICIYIYMIYLVGLILNYIRYHSFFLFSFCKWESKVDN